MHIFLTGDIQVGKSTIIRKFLSQTGMSADGFMTYWEQTGDGGKSLYLSAFSADNIAGAANGNAPAPAHSAAPENVPAPACSIAPAHSAASTPPASVPGAKYLLMSCLGEHITHREHIEDIFDVYGAGILRGAGTCDIIVMDELGFLETNALAFQRAVFERISGNVPILGVIRSKQTAFLDAVRERVDVDLREVTLINRDAVLKTLLADWQRKILT